MESRRLRRDRSVHVSDPDALLEQVKQRIPSGHPREETRYELLYPDWRIERPLRIVFERNYSLEDLPPLPIVEIKPGTRAESADTVAVGYNKGITRQFAAQRQQLDGDYFTYEEPSEETLRATVEYDLDEQDLCWLKLYNAQFPKSASQIAVLAFEKVMDVLEKEWFELVKKLPRQVETHSQPEETVCSICGDGECENINAIVFCDGCNLAVHQDCYGIPYIPEGQWLCRRCMITPQSAPVNCIFCPHTDGAFKQTTNNQWSHLLCALWIPETGVANPAYMEPIDGIENIPKTRWKLVCYICKQRMGACIQCQNKLCYQAFHPMCARKAGLYMKMKLGDDHQIHCQQRFCDKHTPPAYDSAAMAHARVLQCRKLWTGPDRAFRGNVPGLGRTLANGLAPKKRKRGRPPRSSYVQNAEGLRTATPVLPSRPELPKPLVKEAFNSRHPIAPHYLLRIVEQTDAFRELGHIDRWRKLVDIAQYWSLKREAKCGAPLLKRLHLEPWTTLTSEVHRNEKEQGEKIQLMQALRHNLEHARTLVDECRRRERMKQRRTRALVEWVERFVAPACFVVRPALEQLRELDKKQYFAVPVDAKDVPDYYDIVKKPISFQEIAARLDQFEYQSVAQFASDVNLLISNCILYNRKETPFYRAAMKLRTYMHEAAPLLEAQVKAHQKLAAKTFTKDAIMLMFSYHLTNSQLSKQLGVSLSPISTRLQTKMSAR